jgi:hypothetical protein
MLKKAVYETGMVTDGWISIDPTDAEVIEKVYKKDIREGEERLMLAVLQDAVECFKTYACATRPREKRLFQEAEEWILEQNGDWLFSFDNICETLQLHADYLRQGLLSWKDAKRDGRVMPEYPTARVNFVKTRATQAAVRLKTA